MNVAMTRSSMSLRAVGVAVNRNTVSGVVVSTSPDEKSGDQQDHRHQDNHQHQRSRYAQYTHDRTSKGSDPEENFGQHFNLQA